MHPDEHGMASIVIVHGAGSGGWLWQRVRRHPQMASCEVYTPTLTGVGERSHLARPEIDLSTHIQDVVGVLEYEDLSDVVLVGHSYGGMVIAGAADRAASRIAQLVFVDAFVPAHGQSVLDLVPPPIRAAWEEQARTHGDGWKLPPLAVPSLGRIGEDGIEADAARLLLDRRVAQPFGTYAESIQLTNPAAASLPRSYIYCADKTPDDPFLATIHYYRRFASDPAWRTYELATGHFPMLTAPGELTALLQQIAAA